MDKKQVMENLRGIVRKAVKAEMEQIKENDEKVVSLDKQVGAIAKAAGSGLKAIKLLKALPEASHKVGAATEAHVAALEQIFNHMLQSPMDYLDADPRAAVDSYKASLDQRQAAMTGGSEPQGGPPTAV